MLQGYHATIKDNKIEWLETPPDIADDAQVVVMVLPKQWQNDSEAIKQNLKHAIQKGLASPLVENFDFDNNLAQLKQNTPEANV